MGQRKISPEALVKACAEWLAGRTMTSIANELGVTVGCLSRQAHRKGWHEFKAAADRQTQNATLALRNAVQQVSVNVKASTDSMTKGVSRFLETSFSDAETIMRVGRKHLESAPEADAALYGAKTWQIGVNEGRKALGLDRQEAGRGSVTVNVGVLGRDSLGSGVSSVRISESKQDSLTENASVPQIANAQDVDSQG